MAKTISDENIRLNIIINGNSAQKELLDLEKSTREVTKANKELSAAKAKLVAEGKKESEAYKKLSAEIKANNVVLGLNKTKMEALQKEIGITGLTMNQLGQKAKLLKMQLLNAVPGGEAYTRYKEELRQVSARMDELKGKAATAKLSLSSLADGFNKYAALGASVIAMGTGVVLSLQKMIDYNGKLSDAMSDVRKTTGMTKEEVDELTKSFGMLLTRTSRIDLLKIAEEGGRIGIATEEIGAFVDVMNKATVALGDSFTGGVSEVASVLGKLKFLFAETKDLGVDLAYNAIGSAINELGANGVATEQNIANFATRLGSLPGALKPSIADALALGTAFEESGIEAEISARAYNIFLKQASTESDKFAKVMGITTEEVKAMINSNPTEFFLQFSEGLKGMNATETAETLNYLGVNADGANKIVGAAGNNMGRFRELLKLSNDSMIDASSLTNEYGIKNSNLASTLEKVKKTMVGMFSSETIVKGLTTAVEWFAKFIGATEDAEGKTTFWRNGLIALIKTALILTTAIVSYRTALKLATFWTESASIGTASYNLIQKATTLSTNFLAAATALGRAAFFLLTGQLTAAKTAMVAFNLATSLSPIGLVVALVAAATVAYIAFSDASKEAATKQSMLNDATKEANKQIGFERENLKLLLEIARDETRSKQARQLAVDELNKIVPEYNNNLTIESARTLDATDKLNKYIEAKEREIMADILLTEWKKKMAAQQDAENSSMEENIGWMEQSWNFIKSGGQFNAMSAANARTAIGNKQELISLTKQETQTAKELYEAQLRLNDKAGASGSIGGGTGGTGEGDPPKGIAIGGGINSDSKAEANAFKAAEEQLTEFIAKQRAQRIIDGKTALEKELLQVDEKYRVELEKSVGHGEKTKEIEAIRDEEKAALTLKRQAETDLKVKELEDANYIEKESQRLEREALEALTVEERDRLLLERTQFLANAQIDIEEQKAIMLLTLAGATEAEIAAIKEKFALQRSKNDAKNAAKTLADRKKLNADILDGAINLVGQESRVGQALLAIKGALAAKEMLMQLGILKGKAAVSVAGATVATAEGAAQTAKVGFPQNVPLLLAFAAQAVGIISAVKSAVGAAKSTKVEGFEDGLYPITRSQDGKQFNASFGGNTPSGMVNKPTVFMAGENGPELIIDSAAYKQINPDIKYALHREIARVKGFEGGFYPEASRQPASVDGVSSGTANDEALRALLSVVKENTDIMRELKESGVIAYLSNDMKNAKELKKSIEDYEKLRDKNKR
jgi:TP901 family phage tail tape measure protein